MFNLIQFFMKKVYFLSSRTFTDGVLTHYWNYAVFDTFDKAYESLKNNLKDSNYSTSFDGRCFECKQAFENGSSFILYIEEFTLK